MRRARRGEGKLAQKLKAMIIEAFKEYFSTDEVNDCTLWLPTGYYLKSEADVQPVEGCVYVEGFRYVFDSWEKVTELTKHKKVVISQGRAFYEFSIETPN